jgi:hypothetical protein
MKYDIRLSDGIPFSVEYKSGRHTIGVHIFNLGSDFMREDGTPITYGVSWASHGTQPIKDTMEFVACIKKACSIAKLLNEKSLINQSEIDKAQQEIRNIRYTEHRPEVLPEADITRIKALLAKIYKLSYK